MNRKFLLTVVVMLSVTLVTACVSTRFFMSFETVTNETNDPSLGQAVVSSMANQNLEEAESHIREAWSLADKAAEERASNAAAQQQASNALNPTSQDNTQAGDPTQPGTETPTQPGTETPTNNGQTAAKPNDGKLYTEADFAAVDALLAGGETFKSLYMDACICGDSVIAGMSEYDFLDEPYCLGKVGASLYYLEEQIETIVSLNPKHLILHFGTNMLNDSEDYLYYSFIATYVDLCEQLQARMPGVHIVISSLLPMDPEVQASEPAYMMRSAYNQALQEMCAEHGWDYMSNEELASAHLDYLEPDGMHYNYYFYEDYWLKFIYLQAGIGA